jgi:hypothetical protein
LLVFDEQHVDGTLQASPQNVLTSERERCQALMWLWQRLRRGW